LFKDGDLLVKTVVEDLRYLTEEFSCNVKDDSIRRNSNVLRRLLVVGDLSSAWRHLGFTGEPLIPSTNIEDEIKVYDLDDISDAFSGGIETQDGGFSSLISFKKNIKNNMQLFFDSADLRFKVNHYTLSKYLALTSIYIDRDIWITKEEVIKYVSNKLGGVHFDSKRRAKKPLELKYVHLDKLALSLEIGGKHCIYFEMLSIGQAIVKSEDVKKLIQAGLKSQKGAN
jgi:hypothetical protein